MTNCIKAWLKTYGCSVNAGGDTPMTHTIMSGGTLRVPEDLYDEFLGMYGREIERGNRSLAYSEKRSPDVFRMYFDLDILENRALDEGEVLDIVREVQRTTALLFVGADEALKCVVSRTQTKQVEVRVRPPQPQQASCLLENDGDSGAAASTAEESPPEEKPEEPQFESFTKNGVHLNFPKLLVDLDMALQIRFSVVNQLEKRFGQRGVTQNPWSDVVDKAPYLNGLKMIGSVKREQCKACGNSKRKRRSGEEREEQRIETMREIAKIRRKHYRRENDRFDYTDVMSFEGDEYKDADLSRLHTQYHALARMCPQCNNKGWFLEERCYSPTHVLGAGGVLCCDDLHYISNNYHEQMRWTSIRARTHDQVTADYSVPAGHLRPPVDSASACLTAFGSSGLEWVSPGLYREMINADVHLDDAKGLSRWRGRCVQDQDTVTLIQNFVRGMHNNYKNIVVKEAVEIKTGKHTPDTVHRITSGPGAGMVVKGRAPKNGVTKNTVSNMRVYTTYVVRVSGEGSKFCQNKGDEHTSNSVYFCISKTEVCQMCHSGKDITGSSGKVCKRYRSQGKETSVALKKKLFPDECEVDMKKVNAKVAKRPVVAGKKRKLTKKGMVCVDMWNTLGKM